MFNPMMLMQMLSSGRMQPQQMMQMFGNDPMFNQAMQMMQSGGDPRTIINNVAKQKGINQAQLMQLAKQMGIKL